MAAGYWIKLYQDILRDPKMGRLSDSAWRRCIELFLMAGEQDNRDGFLPAVEDMAWELRVPAEQLNKDLGELECAGILKMVDGRWLVSNFKKRQAAVDGRERVQRHREKKAVTGQPPQRNGHETAKKQVGNESVTNGYIDKDIDKEIETDAEKTPKPPQGAAKMTVTGQIVGEGKQRPLISTEQQLLANMVNALATVTGMSGTLNWHTLSTLAGQLIADSYTPEQITTWYSPGGWWFINDWRGRQNQLPGVVAIRETVMRAREGVSTPAPAPAPAVKTSTADDDRKARIARMIKSGRQQPS